MSNKHLDILTIRSRRPNKKLSETTQSPATFFEQNIFPYSVKAVPSLLNDKKDTHSTKYPNASLRTT